MGAPHSKRRGHGSAGKRRTHYEDPIAAIDFARRSGGIEADISRAAGERVIGRRSPAMRPTFAAPAPCLCRRGPAGPAKGRETSK